jgi:hypothetical protein
MPERKMSANTTSRFKDEAVRLSADAWTATQPAASPSPESRNALLFGGLAQLTVPERLFTDNRLTPLDRNMWQVFKFLSTLNKTGLAYPKYHELQPFVATIAYGKRASKETVARAITVLRLTRWITLITKERDEKNGQIMGCVYLVHEEPVTIAETGEFDQSYQALVSASLSHPNKSVRLCAEGAASDVDASDGHIPTRLEAIAKRVSERLKKKPGKLEQYRPWKSVETEPGSKTLGSVSELGEKLLSSDSELRQKSLGSDSEPSKKPTKTDRVRNPNQVQYSTVLSTNTSTVRTVLDGDGTFELHWPTVLRLSETEDREILNALAGLTPEVQQMVLDEAASRIAGGKIRSHSGYLFSIISKAKAGTFKLWAASPRQEGYPPDTSDMTALCSTGTQHQHTGLFSNAVSHSKQGSPPYLNGASPPTEIVSEPRGPKPTSEVARRCLEEIRARARGTG